MSLNKFMNVATGKALKFRIGAEEIEAKSIEVDNFEIKENGSLKLPFDATDGGYVKNEGVDNAVIIGTYEGAVETPLIKVSADATAIASDVLIAKEQIAGKMIVGTLLSQEYILPETRGTDGQILQTNGSGEVSWVDEGSPSDVGLFSALTVRKSGGGDASILTVDGVGAFSPVVELKRNDADFFHIVSDASELVVKNFQDTGGTKGVISIDNLTSEITLNDDVILNGSLKLPFDATDGGYVKNEGVDNAVIIGTYEGAVETPLIKVSADATAIASDVLIAKEQIAGKMIVGTLLSQEYILPETRGTDGQILQTNGSGEVSWVDEGSPSDVGLFSALTVRKSGGGDASILTVDGVGAFSPVVELKRNDADFFHIVSDASELVVKNFQDTGGTKGVISIDNLTSEITLDDDVILNGSLKLASSASPPVDTGDDKSYLYNDLTEGAMWVGSPNIYTTDSSGIKMISSVCYAESYMLGNTLPTTFPAPITSWQTILTNVPIILAENNPVKYGEWTVIGSAIKWNATAPRSIKVKVICSFTQTGGAVLAPREFGIFKGNPASTVITSSKQIVGVEAVGSSFPVNTTLVCITTLAPDDILQLKVSNPDSSQFDVLIPDMSYVITEL